MAGGREDENSFCLCPLSFLIVVKWIEGIQHINQLSLPEIATKTEQCLLVLFTNE